MKKKDISVDCVIFGVQETTLHVLLIKRKKAPEKGMLALPGDFMEDDESLYTCAEKTLKLITGLDNIYLKQIRAFGEMDRYPVNRVITIGYYALINMNHYNPQAGYTAEKLEWHPINKLPDLAFDHNEIIEAGHRILKRKIRLEPIGFNLLPEKFSLTQLQQVYEAVFDTTLNKRNFRNKISQMKLLIDSGEKQQKVAHKPAKLFRFDTVVYERLKSEGFYFNL